MADPLSRPYPRYTSGDWVSFEYTPDTHAIELRYITADTRNAPTILVLPLRRYPDVPQVILAFGDWEYTADTRELWIFDRVEDREAFFGEEQVVQVAP